jgi:DDE superfamily endonuclease
LKLRLLFEDEARFGRRMDPRHAWAPPGVRPLMPRRIEREYGYAYAAVAPHEGALVSLVLPEVNAGLMSLFLAEVGRRYPHAFVLMVLEGAGWHQAGDLVVPAQRRWEWLPARSPELNPAEHLGEEQAPHLPHPHQLVSSGREGKHPSNLENTPMLGLAQQAHPFHPTENLFHPLPFALADLVSGMSCGSPVQGAAAWSLFLLRHRGRHLQISHHRDEIFRVVRLVGGNGDALRAFDAPGPP